MHTCTHTPTKICQKILKVCLPSPADVYSAEYNLIDTVFLSEFGQINIPEIVYLGTSEDILKLCLDVCLSKTVRVTKKSVNLLWSLEWPPKGSYA